MMFVALRRFSGMIDGAEKRFHPGDPITKAEADAMALENKPGLAEKVQTKKGEKHGA